MILPVILAGGSGSRLWPVSRDLLPKQFLPLHGCETMALAAMLNAPKEYALAANNMAISSDYFNSLILPSGQKMLDSLHNA